MRYQLLHTENGGWKARQLVLHNGQPYHRMITTNGSLYKESKQPDYDREYEGTGPRPPYDHLAVLPEGVVGLEHQFSEDGKWFRQQFFDGPLYTGKTRIAAKYIPPQEKEICTCPVHPTENVEGFFCPHCGKLTPPSVKVEGEESQEELWKEVATLLHTGIMEQELQNVTQSFTIKRK